MVIGRKIVSAAIIAVGAAIFCFAVQRAGENRESFYTARSFAVICDAGHGTPDSGAVGAGGSLEKDINLAVVLKLREILEGKGIRVILTRSSDEEYYTENSVTIRQKKVEDMRRRLEIMRTSDADLFVTIHMNSFENPNSGGLNLFYDSHHEEIKPLAEHMQNAVAEVTGAETHSVRTADERLYLMKNPPLPALLVECGFISNPEEEAKLVSDDYQAKIAWAIAETIEEYAKGGLE